MAKDLQSRSMNWTQIIGLAAGVLTASSLIPQVVKTWKEKKSGRCFSTHACYSIDGYCTMDCVWDKKRGFTNHCYQFGFPSGK